MHPNKLKKSKHYCVLIFSSSIIGAEFFPDENSIISSEFDGKSIYLWCYEFTNVNCNGVVVIVIVIVIVILLYII